MQSPRQCPRGVTTLMMMRLLHQETFPQRLGDVQLCRQILITHFNGLRGTPGDFRIHRRHHRNHLPGVFHLTLRQQRIAMS
ncbi:hypothetical protein D3C79_1053810 [compost metagenome]